jgi:hypothetical protein
MPLVAAAAAAMAFWIPGVLHHRASVASAPAQLAAADAAASWEAPDPDAMWEWSAALEAEDDVDVQ